MTSHDSDLPESDRPESDRPESDQPGSDLSAPDADVPIETYPDAPDSLIQVWGKRRRQLKLSPRDWFPPADLDLAPLIAARIPHDLPPL